MKCYSATFPLTRHPRAVTPQDSVPRDLIPSLYCLGWETAEVWLCSRPRTPICPCEGTAVVAARGPPSHQSSLWHRPRPGHCRLFCLVCGEAELDASDVQGLTWSFFTFLCCRQCPLCDSSLHSKDRKPQITSFCTIISCSDSLRRCD